MQDKKIDDLFKDRFEEAEIEPSMDLWNNIVQELEPKHKRIFPVFWMVAASAVVGLVAAALIFSGQYGKVGDGTVVAVNPKPAILKNTEAGTSGHHSNTISAAPKVKTPVLASSATTKIEDRQAKSVGVGVYVKNNGSAAKSTSGLKEIENVNPSKKDLNAMQPVEDIARLDSKPAVVKMGMTGLPKVHQVQPEVRAQTKVGAQKDAIVLASTEIPLASADEVVNENEEADRRGIRNVGDLINFVVDKVDKREDKFLRFKTDDDDNSSLIGINIGMLKFSKREHKK